MVLYSKEHTGLTETRKPRFFYGYVIVMAASITQLIAFGTYTTTGVFLNPIIDEFGWLRATMSGAYTLAYVIMGFSALLGGALCDRLGPRIIITVCAFSFGLGHLLLSQMDAIWQLYLFNFLIGIGIGTIEVVPLATIARWFVRRRGAMTAIAKAGVGLGIALIPMMSSWIISVYGWRNAYVVLGALVLLVIIPTAQLFKRDPGKMNLLPDGEPQDNTNKLGLKEIGLTVRQALHTWQLWVLCIVYLTNAFSMQTIMIHIVPHAKNLGIANRQADSLISVVGAVSIAGRLVMGFAGDKIGNRRAVTICLLVLVAGLIWIQFAQELWMLYLFVTLYGFNHGGIITVISPAVAELFGTRAQGSLLGIVVSIGITISALGPLLAGYIFDVTGGYNLAFLIMLVLVCIGLALSLILKPIKEGHYE
ncbi:MFS transporter [Chloroflexota bacterium]